MKFDYSKLKGKIREKYGSDKKFAEALSIGRVSLSMRLNNKLEFTQSEIIKSVELLNLTPDLIPDYFFKEKI